MLEGGEAAALYIRIACDWKMFLNRQGLEKIFSQVFMAKKKLDTGKIFRLINRSRFKYRKCI